ncbi:MAG: methyltransferase [Candidatus Nanoarchaeia archaeon]
MEEHYYVENPKSKYFEYAIKAKICGFDFTFKSASGIFSAREVDRASKLLIEKANLPKSGKILDLGCGYGLIGIVAAKLCPRCTVVLTDINKRAVKAAIDSLKLNRIRNAEVRQGNVYEPVSNEKFDVILLNPPMAAGRKLVMKMISEAPKHLNNGGSLQIVARKNKGGEFLFKEMDKIFGKTEVLAKSGGFWVVKGVK